MDDDEAVGANIINGNEGEDDEKDQCRVATATTMTMMENKVTTMKKKTVFLS